MRLAKKIDAFLEEEPKTKRLKDVQSQLRVSMGVVEETLSRYTCVAASARHWDVRLTLGTDLTKYHYPTTVAKIVSSYFLESTALVWEADQRRPRPPYHDLSMHGSTSCKGCFDRRQRLIEVESRETTSYIHRSAPSVPRSRRFRRDLCLRLPPRCGPIPITYEEGSRMLLGGAEEHKSDIRRDEEDGPSWRVPDALRPDGLWVAAVYASAPSHRLALWYVK